MIRINKTYIGDCRETMAKFPEGIVQMCVTSPPYWALRDYGVDGQLGMEKTPEEYVANMVEVFRQVKRVLRDDGTLWVNLGDTYLKKELLGIPWQVAFALRADGWKLRSDIIWSKPNAMPEPVKDRPVRAHEYIFLLSKRERYLYDADSIKELSLWDGESGTKNYRPGAIGGRVDAGMNSNGGNGYRNRRTVWDVPTLPFSGAHFAVFPPKLIEPCIKAGARAGDIVLDPFMGSGTTAQVCDKLGRKWLGCDLNISTEALQEERLIRQRYGLKGRKWDFSK